MGLSMAQDTDRTWLWFGTRTVHAPYDSAGWLSVYVFAEGITGGEFVCSWHLVPILLHTFWFDSIFVYQQHTPLWPNQFPSNGQCLGEYSLLSVRYVRIFFCVCRRLCAAFLMYSFHIYLYICILQLWWRRNVRVVNQWLAFLLIERICQYSGSNLNEVHIAASVTCLL